MTMNKKYMHIAYIRTAIKLTSMRDLAERISENSATEVSTVKSDGFVLRRKTDVKVSDSDLETAIHDAVYDILTSEIEDSTDHISEHYDFAFDPDAIIASKLMELFDISRDGRLIYVELDI